MIRKTTAAVVLAGALALGTASATSLGTFDDVTFAASDVDLVDCSVDGSTLELLPDLDASLSLLNSLDIDTFTLDAIAVDIPTDCVDKVADVVLAATDGTVLERLTGTTTETGIRLDPLANGLNSITDIGLIDDVRIVVGGASS